MPTPILFPYPVLTTEPVLRLSQPTIDGQPAQLLAHEHRVDLSSAPDGWREGRVSARVQTPIEELAQLGVRQHEVVLTLHCKDTNIRNVVALEPSGGQDSGQWTGSIDLPRSLLHDRATLYATVAGTVAEVPHRWLGRSREIAVDLLPPRIPEVTGGQIRVVWRDFRTTEENQTPIDPSLHEEMSFVDMSLDEGPVLYLNDAVAGLRRLLDVRSGRTPVERAVRDTALDLIAAPAMVAMANVALAAASPPEDGGEAEWPSVQWQRAVLESLMPLMYPDREPEAALTVATRALTDEGEARDVQTRLLGAASRLVKATQHVRGVIKTLEEN